MLGCLLGSADVGMSAGASWPQSLSPAVPTIPRRGWGTAAVCRAGCLLVGACTGIPAIGRTVGGGDPALGALV